MLSQTHFITTSSKYLNIAVVSFAALTFTTRSDATECKNPVYRGLLTSAIIRFQGEADAEICNEHGTIETISPRHIFQFSTTCSNGYSREYLMLKGFVHEDTVDSLVMRKNQDFTNTDSRTADFILTPDLNFHLYYATNQEGQEALHKVQLDDTWKFEGCGGNKGN